MKPVVLALTLAFAFASSAWGKDLPSTTEFMNIFMSCGMGSSINLEGNLKGSIEDLYQKGRVEGKASQQIMSDIIRLVPEAQRADVYQKYLNCVDKRLSSLEAEKNRKFTVNFTPEGYWIDNREIGDVFASSSSIDFLVDGNLESTMLLSEASDSFDVAVSRGRHTFTYSVDIRAKSGRRTRAKCSVAFDVVGDCTFNFQIAFGPFDGDRDRISSCSLVSV